MEQPLVQSDSSFEPVHRMTTTIKKNSSQTVTVNVPLKPRKERSQRENPNWSCLQNCVSSQCMLQNYKNFKNSDSPARLMHWRDGAWVQLSGDALPVAKSAFLERRPMAEMNLDGNDFIFDFYRMLQIDVGKGLQRSIAWIDVKDNCFFPKFFVDEYLLDDDDDAYGVDECFFPKFFVDEYLLDDDDDAYGVDEDVNAPYQEVPKIEIEIKVDADNGRAKDNDNLSSGGKRKDREAGKLEADNEDSANSSCNNGKACNSKRQRVVVPPPAANEINSTTWPNARLLGEEEKAFSVARDLFMSGMKKIDPNVRITTIHQFTRTGRMEKARWEAFQSVMQMTEAAHGRSNTVFAWHGASKKDVFEILAHGFGRPSKVSDPQAHGEGVYLSPVRLPHLSDMMSEIDDNGEKHLVLCRVILGNMEKIEPGSQQFHPSSVAFDSGVDDLANPKWYVVWSTSMNTHILPECVVSYKRSMYQNGETMGVQSLEWIPDGATSVVARLFSKLGSSLSAPKVEELKTLCMTFKAGKMAKDLFIRQLKSVVGNEMLQSAISEIQRSHGSFP